jgi:succinyl-diaminopimelate desuccinylase
VTLPPCPTDAIVASVRALVACPSQGGIDPPDAVLEAGLAIAQGLGLDADVVDGLALVVRIPGGRPGPTWVLDACIDTAPVGDPTAWTTDPFGGEIRDGWLMGRGTSDSKMGVALFLHLAAALKDRAPDLAGTLVVLADADEHTGRFGGIRAFLDRWPDVAGVMIGYPENDAVFVGARGFWRATIDVFGVAEHSGYPNPSPRNAVVKAARLIDRLSTVPLPAPPPGDDFPRPPKLTVTMVEGGAGYAMVPDRARVSIDVRLTPLFDAGAAAAHLGGIVADLDRAMDHARPSTIALVDTWPAYRLAPGQPLADALVAGATLATGRAVPAQVCGPSNIANLLAGRGIPATCGFGVTCRGVHGADEAALIADVPMVWTAYATAVSRLMGG